MTTESRNAANWLVASVALLALLVIGGPLLVPLAFTILISAVLNAIVEVLLRLKLPRWLAWVGTLALLIGAIYLVTRVVAGQAADFDRSRTVIGACRCAGGTGLKTGGGRP
jgi:predicted PurR-regulated permease PerM